jgi:hypothetical protein
MENTNTDGQDEDLLCVEHHLQAWVEHEIFKNQDHCLPSDYPDQFFDLTGYCRRTFHDTVVRARNRILSNT